MNDQQTKFANRLHTDFPDLDVVDIEIIGSGYHHVAMIVNGNLIFRMPKNNRTMDEIRSSVIFETSILKLLKDKLPVSVPDPQYIAPDGSYFGYPVLDGLLLKNIHTEQSEAQIDQLTIDWVDVAVAIHKAVPVEAAQDLHSPYFEALQPNGRDEIVESSKRIFTIPELDDRLLSFARQMIDMLETMDVDNQQVVFIHNDLQYANLLMDSATKRLCGVIDWTDACIAPIAREFATGQFMSKSRNTLENTIKLYEQKTGTTVDIMQAVMWRFLEEINDYVAQVEAGEADEAKDTLGRLMGIVGNWSL